MFRIKYLSFNTLSRTCSIYVFIYLFPSFLGQAQMSKNPNNIKAHLDGTTCMSFPLYLHGTIPPTCMPTRYRVITQLSFSIECKHWVCLGLTMSRQPYKPLNNTQDPWAIPSAFNAPLPSSPHLHLRYFTI